MLSFFHFAVTTAECVRRFIPSSCINATRRKGYLDGKSSTPWSEVDLGCLRRASRVRTLRDMVEDVVLMIGQDLSVKNRMPVE